MNFQCRILHRVQGIPKAIWVGVVLGFWNGIALGSNAPPGEKIYPSTTYYGVFRPFYEGEYQDALRGFQEEIRSAFKTVETRWIDSICYYTMAGECYYHMGDLGQALEHYTAALKLYAAYPDWMIYVQFPAHLAPAGVGAYVRVPWGVSKRNVRLAQIPNRMLIALGQLDQQRVIREGGVVRPPMLLPIQPAEIVRTTCLALRRYAELTGPCSAQDPLIQEIATKLGRRPGPPNHWSECWIDVQAGLAMLAAGKPEQGLPLLQRSLLAAGEYEHPLSCVALLELGKQMALKGQHQEAARYFEEATYAAANAGDLGVLEEAFRYGAINHLVSNAKGIYPPLEAAIAWAKLKDYRQLRASLLLLAAEQQTLRGATPLAATLLEECKLTIGRRRMADGWIGARYRYLMALVLLNQQKLPAAQEALASALAYMQKGSHRLFHIGLVDRLFVSGRLSSRTAMDLFGLVLRDPQPADWAFDPLESLAVLVSPHPAAYEHWFEVALDRKDFETALEIADRLRRHRFLTTLSLGGRVDSLRWILESPVEALSANARLQRQNLLAAYPAYVELSRQAQQIREALAAGPLVPEDQAAQQAQAKALEQLGQISLAQEALVYQMALRREPTDLIFPPIKTTKEILASLPKGGALLVFFNTSRAIYGFFLADGRYSYWQLKSSAGAAKLCQSLLRELGHYEGNRELTIKELADPKWRSTAQKLLQMLLEGSRADLNQVTELVVVPDGWLWYVPFEALLLKDAGGNQGGQPLLWRMKIRYLPLASLVVPDGRGRRPSAKTAVVVGRLFPRDEEQVAQAAYEKLAQVVRGTTLLRRAPPGPSSLYGVLFDQLIVLDDLGPLQQGPYRWAPIPLERSRPGNQLEDWFALPFGGPDVIVLPGYHTAAETALKQPPPLGPGMDIFLPLCGLMNNGARTILLSRWRPAGKTAFDLVREFAQEIPYTTAAEAWQRAVLLAANQTLDPEAEPRLKKPAPDEEPPKTDHPFFWAGYLLVDTGVPPQAADKPAGDLGQQPKPLPFPPLPKMPDATEPPKSPKASPDAKLPGATLP
ncbi:MAG: CHAT domain-containing protein [Thermoguttaceae bacterium]|nr:CHAT domain-containing protein [Thermoguttaceae bacterium]MDW8038116.1 CHAT domain-containing protein [Thermoguttaceae bacterium]